MKLIFNIISEVTGIPTLELVLAVLVSFTFLSLFNPFIFVIDGQNLRNGFGWANMPVILSLSILYEFDDKSNEALCLKLFAACCILSIIVHVLIKMR